VPSATWQPDQTVLAAETTAIASFSLPEALNIICLRGSGLYYPRTAVRIVCDSGLVSQLRGHLSAGAPRKSSFLRRSFIFYMLLFWLNTLECKNWCYGTLFVTMTSPTVRESRKYMEGSLIISSGFILLWYFKGSENERGTCGLCL
jgi:hypothetical protein